MRESWDSYFMAFAVKAASRSTCLRRKVGAIAVVDRHILATGYNGACRGAAHCEDIGGCLREKLHIPSGERHEICRAVHAEQNLVAQCAKHGQSMNLSTVYCTNSPCFICAKILINSGVSEVVYLESYSDELAIDAFSSSNITCRKL